MDLLSGLAGGIWMLGLHGARPAARAAHERSGRDLSATLLDMLRRLPSNVRVLLGNPARPRSGAKQLPGGDARSERLRHRTPKEPPMKHALIIGLGLVIAPIAAQAQMNPPTAKPSVTLPTSTTPANAGKLSPTDSNFLSSAVTGGMAEVQAGQIALQQGDPAVKTVAQRMIADHTKANDELATIAKSQGLETPSQVDPVHAAALAQLRAARGSGFDNQYLNGQLADHQKTIGVFQQEADQGTNQELKAFAAKTLPTLQSHLQMIKEAIHNGSGHRPS
jgi:putative membrane protein